MRKIFLVRHAESVATTAQSGDFQRILTDNGKALLVMLAESLRSHVEGPVEIHCSHAKRTVETATILARHLDGSVHPCEYLYEGDSEDYLHLMRSLEDRPQFMLVGHNPVISAVQHHLSGIFSPFQPGTCAILVNDGGSSWRQVALIQPGEQGTGLNPNLNA